MSEFVILNPQELAYLDRFCYEVEHFLHGEGSVFQQCPGHYRNLGAPTDFAPKDGYQQLMSIGRPAPPVRRFPWRSLDDIPARVAELGSQARRDHDHSSAEARSCRTMT